MKERFKPTVENREQYRSRVAEERERILQEVENRTEGVNTERVEAFAENLGITPTDYRLIEPDQIPQVAELLKLDKDSDAMSKAAFYSRVMDVVFVLRDQAHEDANGPEYTEGVLLHELVHGSKEVFVPIEGISTHASSPSLTTKRTITARSGFAHAVKRSAFEGAYLEEGLADMARGKYMKEYMSDALKDAINKSTNVDFSKSPTEKSFVWSTSHGEVDVPGALFYIDGESGDVRPHEAAFAAAGLETLCTNIDGLEEALWAARKNVEGLRDVAKLINSADKDLYSFLMKLKYDGDDFIKGTHHIQQMFSENEAS